MKSGLLLFFFLLSYASPIAFSQKMTLEWDRRIIEEANTASNENYLSEEEKKVIFYTNLVRLDPKLFEKTYLANYLDSAKFRDSKWIFSLKKELKEAKPSEPLTPQKDLYEVAKAHAIDMGKSGKIGHVSSNGTYFSKRIEMLKKNYDFIYENCQYGYKDALSIVIDLLIDEGIQDFGHRKAILNPALKFTGASIQPHRRYRFNCVIDYGTELTRSKM